MPVYGQTLVSEFAENRIDRIPPGVVETVKLYFRRCFSALGGSLQRFKEAGFIISHGIEPLPGAQACARQPDKLLRQRLYAATPHCRLQAQARYVMAQFQSFLHVPVP